MITEYYEDNVLMPRACRAARMSWDSEHKSDSEKFLVGPNDLKLARKLMKAGSDHSAAFRQAVVHMKITASRGWWQHFAKYRIGVEMYSQSVMHTGVRKQYTRDMFRNEGRYISDETLKSLNNAAEENDLEWLTEILPESFLQTRSIMMSYPAMRSIYASRSKHRKPEWREFLGELVGCVKYPELVTGE
jgi:hypothetical protein